MWFCRVMGARRILLNREHVILEGSRACRGEPIGSWFSDCDSIVSLQNDKKMKQYYVYIMTNKRNTTLYTGFTGKGLKERIWEHKNKVVAGFTKKYNINKLVYYEVLEDAYAALTREKQIKNLLRRKKIKLIKKNNSEWKDLYEEL